MTPDARPSEDRQAQAPHAPPDAEAARYALLRRLAPSMRHHLVVNLQPIGMIHEVMERRMKAPQPNITEIHESATKINGFARAALHSILDIVTWLAPDEAATTTLGDGIGECLGLLATSFTFRGFTLRNEAQDVPGKLRRSSVRNVLPAVLFHFMDTQPAPAEIVLTAEDSPQARVVAVQVRQLAGEPGFAAAPGYRDIQWPDVLALAAADGVRVEREGAGTVRLEFPLA
jgi:hypothetical protein